MGKKEEASRGQLKGKKETKHDRSMITEMAEGRRKADSERMKKIIRKKEDECFYFYHPA